MHDVLRFDFSDVPVGQHDGLHDLLPSILAEVEFEADLGIHVFDLGEVPADHVFEEIVDRRVLILVIFLDRVHDDQKLVEVELAVSVLVDGRDQFANVVSRAHEPQSDQRLLELLDADRARAVVVQRLEDLSVLLALVVRKVDELRFPVRVEPLPQVRVGELLLNLRSL